MAKDARSANPSTGSSSRTNTSSSRISRTASSTSNLASKELPSRRTRNSGRKRRRQRGADRSGCRRHTRAPKILLTKEDFDKIGNEVFKTEQLRLGKHPARETAEARAQLTEKYTGCVLQRTEQPKTSGRSSGRTRCSTPSAERARSRSISCAISAGQLRLERCAGGRRQAREARHRGERLEPDADLPRRAARRDGHRRRASAICAGSISSDRAGTTTRSTGNSPTTTGTGKRTAGSSHRAPKARIPSVSSSRG